MNQQVDNALGGYEELVSQKDGILIDKNICLSETNDEACVTASMFYNDFASGVDAYCTNIETGASGKVK